MMEHGTPTVSSRGNRVRLRPVREDDLLNDPDVLR